MKRMGAVGSAGWRALAGLGLALTIAAVPHTAFAQETPPAAPPQADLLKFSAAAPVQLVIQVHGEKAADFEGAWAGIRAGLAKSTVAEHAPYNASLGNLFKVDTGATDNKVAVYVLRLDAPVVGVSYDPFKTIWEVLYKTGEGSILKYDEANALFEKLKGSLAGMQLWKMNKIGG
jgi:hypothetical protein